MGAQELFSEIRKLPIVEQKYLLRRPHRPSAAMLLPQVSILVEI